MSAKRSRTRPWYRRTRFLLPIGLVTALGLLAVVAFVSPWPSALLIRAVFERAGADVTAEMQEYAPPPDTVRATLNVPYGPDGADNQLDLFSPHGSTEPLPTIVWIHGGAWIQGDKASRDPYARLLAVQGYTVATVNYTVAPDAIYPTALHQLNTALGFLRDNADRFGIDPDRIVIAGDSAGSQLASQLATIITNPAYADEVGIRPNVVKEQLVGVILNCGVFDLSEVPNAAGIEGWGFRVALWAYLGTKQWSSSPGAGEMSTIDHVTTDFPPTWISGGNGDALTAAQSKPFAARLDELGVDVTALFFAEDTEPALPHEYQFHLRMHDAQVALQSTIAWLGDVTGEPRT